MSAPTHPSVDDCRDRLHQAGWSISETAESAIWIVAGINGDHQIKSAGRTQAEAWHRAILQANVIIPEYPLTREKAPAVIIILALLAWLWLVASLPFLTDASCNIFVGFALTGTWLVLAGAWIVLLLCMPSLLLIPGAGRRWWLTTGLAGCLGLVLAFTDVGLILRIALCESSLSGYAAQIPPNGGKFIHAAQPVGLFLVNGEENYQGVVFLYTSNSFLNREGVAFVPPGTIPSSQIPRRRLRHLYGPWYWFTWKF